MCKSVSEEKSCVSCDYCVVDNSNHTWCIRDGYAISVDPDPWAYWCDDFAEYGSVKLSDEERAALDELFK